MNFKTCFSFQGDNISEQKCFKCQIVSPIVDLSFCFDDFASNETTIFCGKKGFQTFYFIKIIL